MFCPWSHLWCLIKINISFVALNIVQWFLGVASSDGITKLRSLSESNSGITSLIDWESATYSLSVVDSVISVTNLEHHMMEKFAYKIT